MIATVIVHWPGKDVAACHFHAMKLMDIARTIDCDVSVTPIISSEPEVQCKNCENEAAAKQVQP